ncbi:UNVERIFIED_ORG: hypothetical protein DFS12_10554 [Chitinophaga ginsengisegetis]|nr:hypothetical protein [Chitinophaga ginsengisegetis]MDR6648613.1 hypothetical protein [Chitinophaga ginsengisegetis]MDR6655439.1 hypothetical protein [Chitinophaga ginsengisegetis]
MERSFQAAVQTQKGPDNRPLLRFMLLLFTEVYYCQYKLKIALVTSLSVPVLPLTPTM